MFPLMRGLPTTFSLRVVRIRSPMGATNSLTIDTALDKYDASCVVSRSFGRTSMPALP